MGLLRRTWDVVGWIAGGAVAYQQWKAIKASKDDLYSQLNPDQQAEWEKVFGKPDAASNISAPPMPPVVMKPVPVPSALAPVEQLKAGT